MCLIAEALAEQSWRLAVSGAQQGVCGPDGPSLA
jgi:hypothetical protein